MLVVQTLPPLITTTGQTNNEKTPVDPWGPVQPGDFRDVSGLSQMLVFQPTTGPATQPGPSNVLLSQPGLTN